MAWKKLPDSVSGKSEVYKDENGNIVIVNKKNGSRGLIGDSYSHGLQDDIDKGIEILEGAMEDLVFP